jgi:small redox-active disulfide protein 2
MMKLKVLGTGCPKCATLALNADVAARSLGLDYVLEKVTDLDAIVEAGVMSTPGLAIDGEVKSVGRVLSVEEIKRLLT